MWLATPPVRWRRRRRAGALATRGPFELPRRPFAGAPRDEGRETAMGLLDSIKRDIKAARRRDPAAINDLEVVLTYPGFHARQLHRISYALHKQGLEVPARLVSHRGRVFTGFD